MSRHWTVVLCHVTNPMFVRQILSDARRRVGVHEPPGDALDILVCPERAFTTSAAERAADMPAVVRLPGLEPLIVIGGTEGFRPPVVDAAGSPRGITFLLVGSMVIFALEGVVITILERSACRAGCTGGLTRYPDALYWLLSHVVLLGDPEGLVPAAGSTRIIGLLAPLAGLVLVGCVAVAIWRSPSRRGFAARAMRTTSSRAPSSRGPRPRGERPPSVS